MTWMVGEQLKWVTAWKEIPACLCPCWWKRNESPLCTWRERWWRWEEECLSVWNWRGGHWCCQLQGTSICLKTSCPLGYLEEKMEMSGATLGAGYLSRIEVCCISFSTSFRDLIFLVLLCVCMLCITLRTPKRKGVIGIMYNLQEAAQMPVESRVYGLSGLALLVWRKQLFCLMQLILLFPGVFYLLPSSWYSLGLPSSTEGLSAVLGMLRSGLERSFPADDQYDSHLGQGRMGGHCDSAAPGHQSLPLSRQQQPERSFCPAESHPIKSQPHPGKGGGGADPAAAAAYTLRALFGAAASQRAPLLIFTVPQVLQRYIYVLW